MAPARKKSMMLGLEEEASGGGGGGGGETVSSSSSDAKKMYVFVSHECWEYDYSLFALDIPSPDTIVKTKPTVVTPPSVSRSEPERSPVLPILRFRQGDGWTLGMRCILLGQKLYFLGGHIYGHNNQVEGEGGHYDGEITKTYPNQVHALDLSQEVKSRHRNDAHKVVEQVASMNTGKDGFIVSFVADGKIFLVATKGMVKFEIFNPSEGEGVWRIGAPPPFGHRAYVYPPLVLGRKAYFYGHIGGFEGRFTCIYTIDDESWSDYRVIKDYDFLNFDGFSCSGEDFFLMAGGVVVGESTIWNVCGKKVPAVVRFDITKEKQVEKKDFSSNLRYYIQHPAYADDSYFPYGAYTFGTSLAAVEEDSRRLCFLQVDDGGVDPTRMSLILFERGGGGGESPKYLTSAHYFVKMDRDNPTYRLIDAHIIDT